MENTVLSACLPFAAFFTLRDEKKAKIDNFPDRLHYKFTAGFLFLSTAILSMDKMWGDSINCVHNTPTAKEAHKAVTQYCWVTGTYTVPVPAPDIEIINETEDCKGRYRFTEGYFKRVNESGTEVETSKCRRVHNYYQWVPYVLVLSGFLFMLPNRLWRYLEEEKIASIVRGIQDEARDNVANSSEYSKQKEIVVNNVAKFIVKLNNTSHLKYAVSFMVCQFLNILNLFLNYFIMEIFLNWNFTSLGYGWLRALDSKSMILSDVFPRMTMCQWREIGSGAGIVEQNYLCLLGTNRITEKIFVFYWFWLITLIIITLLSFLYYCTMFCSKSIRWRDRFLAISINDTKDAKTRGALSMQEQVHDYLGTLPSTKFFFLYLVGQNVDYDTLKALSHKIYELTFHYGRIQGPAPAPATRQSMFELNISSAPSKFEVTAVQEDEEALPAYSPYNTVTGYPLAFREHSF